MKLEPKHIAPYLPYGLKILRPDNKTILELNGIVNNLYVFDEIGKNETYGSIKSNTNKPILRPFSDINKEIEHNCEKFVPIEILTDEFDFTYSYTQSLYIYEYPYNVVEKLFEWHFDYFDLIPNGLAIDINTLNNKS